MNGVDECARLSSVAGGACRDIGGSIYEQGISSWL